MVKDVHMYTDLNSEIRHWSVWGLECISWLLAISKITYIHAIEQTLPQKCLSQRHLPHQTAPEPSKLTDSAPITQIHVLYRLCHTAYMYIVVLYIILYVHVPVQLSLPSSLRMKWGKYPQIWALGWERDPPLTDFIHTVTKAVTNICSFLGTDV